MIQNIYCLGGSCSNITDYSFTQPADVRYEKLSEIDFFVKYDWSGKNLTLGQGYVNFSDDLSNERIVWQDYSHSATSGSSWNNYTIESNDQSKFISANRNIGINSYTAATSGANGNVT